MLNSLKGMYSIGNTGKIAITANQLPAWSFDLYNNICLWREFIRENNTDFANFDSTVDKKISR